MSLLVFHDPNAALAQTVAPSALTGVSATNALDPSELGSRIPQSM